MIRFLPVLFCVLLFSACTPPAKPAPEKTQLEIREFQTRTFDVSDLRMVMKSILNTLQDDAFIVKNVALDLGFLTATKEIDIEDDSARFWSQFARANDARWVKHEVIEATVNVSEFGKKVRVRVNFQSKVLDNKGAVVSIDQIIDEKFYKEFFAKVDKGVFLQQQEI
jgi:hypothetical protein